jgi:hypothetical protein
MKNTFMLFMLIFVEALGVTMCLILLYSSPTEQVQAFEAAIVYLGTSILVASILFHLTFEQEKDNLLRLSFILLGIALISYGIIFALIITYASPDTVNPVNTSAVLLFILSTCLVLIGYIFMIKHNPKEISHEK